MQKIIKETREIKRYFDIDKRIRNRKRKIKELNDTFYSQNMYTRSIAAGDLGIITLGFRCDNKVTKHVDGVHHLEKSIKILEKKKHFFRKYLESLGDYEKEKIISRYRGNEIPEDYIKEDQEVYEEIQEIEVAIDFMNGYLQDVDIEVITENKDSEIGSVNAIAELLGV